MRTSKKSSEKSLPTNAHQMRIGAKMSFAVKEAYKQLRTNLDFSLNDVDGCKVIGITSALRSEGKSMTAGNLSYTLAEAGFRVLLIEGDMRLPNLAKRFHLNDKPGLSNALSANRTIEKVIQTYSSGGDIKISFSCITSGSIPPNPSELLGSRRMEQTIEELKNSFDYIVIDLPPVTAVSDAQAVSKYVDGMLLVVRQDYSLRSALAETIRQLQFCNVRILGFVCTFVSDDNGGGYSRRYRYRKNYKYYANSYHPESETGEKTDEAK